MGDFGDEDGWMDFILMAMAGAGDIIAHQVPVQIDITWKGKYGVRDGERNHFGSLQADDFFCKI